jgi:hypothetical protein
MRARTVADAIAVKLEVPTSGLKRGAALTRTSKPLPGAERQRRRLSRNEITLIGVGVGVWIAIAAGGVWLARVLATPHEHCSARDDPTREGTAGPATPGNSFSVLTGPPRCK